MYTCMHVCVCVCMLVHRSTAARGAEGNACLDATEACMYVYMHARVYVCMIVHRTAVAKEVLK